MKSAVNSVGSWGVADFQRQFPHLGISAASLCLPPPPTPSPK